MGRKGREHFADEVVGVSRSPGDDRPPWEEALNEAVEEEAAEPGAEVVESLSIPPVCREEDNLGQARREKNRVIVASGCHVLCRWRFKRKTELARKIAIIQVFPRISRQRGG